MTRIEICLGSSCFARGGDRFPAVAAEWLREHRVQAELRGRRCEQACEHGPTVVVDGVPHHVPDAAALRNLMAQACLAAHA